MATVLDRPVAAIEGQDARGVGTLRGMTGHAVDGLARALAGLFLNALAFDGEHLADARKVEVVVEAGGGPDRALLDATMGQGGRLAEVGLTALGEDQADIGVQGRLVVFDGEDVVGAARDEIVGQRALGQEGVGGDGLAADVEGVEDRDGHPNLIGLLERVAAVDDGQHADFFWVWQVWLWWPTTPRIWV